MASGFTPASGETLPGRPDRSAGPDGRRAAGPDTTISRSRQVLAWTLALAGLLAYNWWLLVPLKPGLMTSPNELFSNLEVSGQPYAAAMQHADLLSGVLLFGAFLAAGRRRIPAGHRDWLAMLAFAVGGAAGGLFPEVCADGISALCREQEVHFQLPAGQYVHIVAGIAEFSAITIALILAIRRTRPSHGRYATVYRRLGIGAIICYPLLGLAYLVNRMGGVMEAVFFVGFTVMVATQIAERTSRKCRRTAERQGTRTLTDCSTS
jgi:hypothetical protein